MIKFILVLAGNHPETKESLISGLQTVKDKFFVKDVVPLAYNGPIKDLHDMFQDYFSQYGQTVQAKNLTIMRTIADMGFSTYGRSCWNDLLHSSLRQIAAVAEPMGVVVSDVASTSQLNDLKQFADELGGVPVIAVRLKQAAGDSPDGWHPEAFNLTVDPDATIFHLFGPVSAAIRAKIQGASQDPTSCHAAVQALNGELKKLLAQGYGADFKWFYDQATGCKQLKLQKLLPVVKLDKQDEDRIAQLTAQTLSEAQPAVPVAVPPTEMKSEASDGSGPAAGEALSDAGLNEGSPADDSGNTLPVDGAGGLTSDGSSGAGLSQDVVGDHQSGSESAVGT